MSSGDKVYKIRNKRTGELVRRGMSTTPNYLWDSDRIPFQVAKELPDEYEVVEFTLSDPRVVTL
jgi:hypothetical protein